MSRRGKSLRRKAAPKVPKNVINIFCEGGRTEPDYFNALRLEYPVELMDVHVVPAAGVPRTLFEKANMARKTARSRLRRGESFSEGDQYWIVFDRDDHPLIEQTIGDCSRCGIEFAFSDPCFELWLILHIENFDRPDDRNAVQGHLGKVEPTYERREKKVCDFRALVRKVEDAEARAKAQHERREKEGDGFSRPVTTVYRLTRRLRNLDPPPESP